MLEKDMENLIALYPEEIIEEKLELISRQETLSNSRRPDLIFKDQFGRHLIIEIQRGHLDEDHIKRMIDYYGAYKFKNPKQIVRLMFIAYQVHSERKEFITQQGFEFKEISNNKFIDIAEKKNYKFEIKEKEKEASVLIENNTSKLPKLRYVENETTSIILEKFNDYMMKYVLNNKDSIKMQQLSAWIYAHKAGLKIYLYEHGRTKQSVKAYFEDVENNRIEKHMSTFYKNVMKLPTEPLPPKSTILADITIYHSGNKQNRLLEFVKNGTKRIEKADVEYIV